MDMVVTLHACDTATDYALAKAVEWELKSFFPYPAVSEVNKQIKNEMLEPVLRYGILKERMSALITDAVRADLLESKGYDTQILSLLIWNTNRLLIRAVRTGKDQTRVRWRKMLAALNIHPTLDRLLNEKEQEGVCDEKDTEKAGILLLVFLLGTAGTALHCFLTVNPQITVLIFNDAVFPEVMVVDMNDTLINRMYGYAQPMQADLPETV